MRDWKCKTPKFSIKIGARLHILKYGGQLDRIYLKSESLGQNQIKPKYPRTKCANTLDLTIVA